MNAKFVFFETRKLWAVPYFGRPIYYRFLPKPELSHLGPFSFFVLFVLFDLLLIGPLCPQRCSIGSFYAARGILYDVLWMRSGCGPLKHIASIDTGIRVPRCKPAITRSRRITVRAPMR
jgi:hypothetical protein